MTGQTLTRAELAETLLREVGLSRTECANLVDQVLDLITSALTRGEDVKVSAFGTFQVRHKNPRIGRNPKTGAQAQISERQVVTFRASHILKNKVNGTASDSGDDE